MQNHSAIRLRQTFFFLRENPARWYAQTCSLHASWISFMAGVRAQVWMFVGACGFLETQWNRSMPAIKTR
jgi:hypothetical protein